ncbi:MAG TPA: hypothetical protein ENI84_01115 [Thiothrix sp.]|nr:hypothetical protein [Thiothrix sp.]
MAWTSIDVAALEEAIASGKRAVKLNGRTIEYQSIQDMIKALNFIKKTIKDDEIANSEQGRRKVYRVRQQRKGL